MVKIIYKDREFYSFKSIVEYFNNHTTHIYKKITDVWKSYKKFIKKCNKKPSQTEIENILISRKPKIQLNIKVIFIVDH